MERRRLGKTELQVGLLGFGASEIGYEGASITTVERLFGAALDAGLNLIDTAACYAASEELIGRAAASRRKDYYLLTKCGHDGAEFHLPDWSPALIGKSIERSLKRLRTDYLDVVQLHTCEAETLQQGDVINELERARAHGLTRFIGYSGDSSTALMAVESGAFDTLQISVNVADQEAIELVLPAAMARDMGVIAKRPIANAAWLSRMSAIGYSGPYWRRLRKLRYGFFKASSEESVATALQFTLSVPGVHTAIVGTAKPSRWAQNAALIARGALPAAEYAAIRDRWRKIAPADWIGQR